MYEAFKNRMQLYGKTDGMARVRQSELIMDASFTRDTACKKVYVKWIDCGLPEIDPDVDAPLDAKFNAKSYHTITGDEVAYLLQFRKSDTQSNDQIKVGSYVYIPNEYGEMEWWLLIHYDDRPQFRQWSILRCLWVYKWVSAMEGNRYIHFCLGAPRKQNSYNAGTWYDQYTQTTENQDVAWMPTNKDTLTIMYDTRMLKSDPARRNPLSWSTSKIEDSIPSGLTKITLAQDSYDPTRDNPDLMVANYYANVVPPIEISKSQPTIRIVCAGAYSVSAGGGYKKFTAEVYEGDTLLEDIGVEWTISFPEGDEEKFVYEISDNDLKIKCLPYYDLIGSTFTATASATVYGADVENTITVEVTGT